MRGALPPAPPGRGMIPLHPHPRFRAGFRLPATGAEAAEEHRPSAEHRYPGGKRQKKVEAGGRRQEKAGWRKKAERRRRQEKGMERRKQQKKGGKQGKVGERNGTEGEQKEGGGRKKGMCSRAG